MPNDAPRAAVRWCLGLAIGAGLWTTSLSAWGYCRTTTCDRTKEACRVDPKTGCLAEGTPLFWPDACVTFGVHAEGSPRRGITYREAERAATRAFQAWVSVDCGNQQKPSVGVVPMGEIYCGQVEFNYPTVENDRPPAPNANVILFRDDGWPHEEVNKTLALTTVTFSRSTGEILDADIEVNSFGVALSTDERAGSNDLQSILTHEAGHFLGLDHSHISDATMHASYSTNVTDMGFRSLDEDDERAICAVYPPGAIAAFADADLPREQWCRGEGPRYGFSRFCGEPVQADAALLCSVRPGGVPSRSNASALLVAALAGACRLRRRARSMRSRRHSELGG